MGSSTAYASVLKGGGSETSWFPLSAVGVHESVANWLRKRFDALIGSVHLPGLVQYDNAPAIDPAGALHADLAVRFGDSEDFQASYRSENRISGELAVLFRAPLEQGDKGLRELADTTVSVFREAVVPVDVVLKVPTLGSTTAARAWHEAELSFPFFYIDRRARPSGNVTAYTGSLEEVGNTIRSRFKTRVADAHSIAVVYDNAPHAQTAGTKWARWSVTQSRAFRSEHPGVYRTLGIAIAQVFVPVGTGDQSALEIADTVYEEFGSAIDTGVQFGIPSVRTVGRGGEWWQVNVSCPFTSYQHG